MSTNFRAIATLIDAREYSAARERIKALPCSDGSINDLLIYLCFSGSGDWADFICEFGCDFNYVDCEGNTPLSACIQSSKSEVDKFDLTVALLNNGASPDSRYLSYTNVISLALSWGLRSVFSCLLLAGADLSCIDPRDLEDARMEDGTVLRDSCPWVRGVVEVAAKSRPVPNALRIVRNSPARHAR
jgi:ankyrin repeat protein